MADPHQSPAPRDAGDVMERTAPPPTRTTAYGSDPAQVYDVRLPAGTAADVTVVVVHGGFWRERFDRSHAGCQAAIPKSWSTSSPTMRRERPT